MEEDSEKTDRPLSPVLNKNNLHRKRIFERKRSKTRVRLAKRFVEDEVGKGSAGDDFEFKVPMSPGPSAKKFKPNFNGFCTGSGKNVVVSPEALKKHTELFGDILKTDLDENNPRVFKKDFSNLSFSKNVLRKHSGINAFETSWNATQILLDAEAAVCMLSTTISKNVVEGDCLKNQVVVQETLNTFLGFPARDYEISCRILEDYKKLLDDYNKPDPKPNLGHEATLLDNTLCKVFADEDLTFISSVSNRKNDPGLISLDRKSENVLEDTKRSSMASEKQIFSSGKGLFVGNKPEIKFKSEEGNEEHIALLHIYEDLSIKQGHSTDFIKESTASGKDIQRSAAACENSTNILSDEPENPLSQDNVQLQNVGFSTASGKNISITEKAWANTKDLFSADHFCNPKTNESPKEATPMQQKPPPLSTHFLCENDLKTVGFSSASGKNINITKRTWTKTKNLFSDELLSNAGSEELRNKITSTEVSSHFNSTNDLQKAGFSTASGKNISITDKAWRNTKDLFSDDLFCNPKTTESSKEAASSTYIQSKPPPLSTHLLCEKDLKTVGFSSASGKNINITERAWTKTKDLFGDELLSNPGSKELRNKITPTEVSSHFNSTNDLKKTGFSTASGKNISITEKAWGNTKDLFSDDLFCNPKANESSKEATSIQQKHPPLSTHFLCENDLKTVGFSSANGKNINITERALTKTKDLFADELLSNAGSEELRNKITSTEVSSHINSTNDLKKAGFSTASGKNISITDKAWRNTKDLFSDDIFCNPKTCESSREATPSTSIQPKPPPLSTHLLCESNLKTVGFSSTSGKNNITEKVWTKTKDLFADELLFNTGSDELRNKVTPTEVSSHFNSTNDIKKARFSTSSGKNISITDKAWRNTKDLFSDELFCNPKTIESSAETKSSTSIQLKSPLLSTHLLCKNDLKIVGFSSASGKNINITKKAWIKTKDLFADEVLSNTESEEIGNDVTSRNDSNYSGFSTANRKNINIVENSGIKTNDLFVDQNLTDEETRNLQGTSFPSERGKKPQTENSSRNQSYCGLEFSAAAGKSIEINKYQTTNVPADKFKNNKDILDSSREEQTPDKQHDSKKRLRISGCKQIQIRSDSLDKAKMFFKESEDNLPTTPVHSNIYSSTPLKQSSNLSKQVLKHTFLSDLNITPVKRPLRESHYENSAMVMQMQTEGDTEVWIKNMQKEYESLQQVLYVILERQKALEEQKQFLSSQNSARTRQVLGVLSEKRQLGERIGLKQALGNRRPGDVLQEAGIVKGFSWSVTPQNAINVHFNCSWNNECPVVLYTKDGAVLIPTLNNLIGLSEIKAAFKAMLGVNPKLIPRGWIDNHFKWIVWKLASYERNFPDVFSETLTVENIVQQLKYRYDREIDRAERSALRRILETDDVPQKRMVLCVSAIIKVGNSLEVELTDGWYSVRTIIDELLRKQINSSKIIVGTKLITQCAEILNCDGCHPLEVPEHVRLKINFNCTRRATWDAKLGYQKIVTPFPVGLDSVCFEGGIIGCVKIYIVRVYPLRYMEKFTKGKAVWRNAKAEEKRMREWEVKKIKELEMLHKRVREEYEKELKNESETKVPYNNLSEIKSSETLYRLLEASHDPDSFKEKLTPSQLSSIMDYHHNVHNQRNNEISMRVSKELKKLKNSQREVYPLLKLLIVDRLKNSRSVQVLNIWKPTEEHLVMLKEGSNYLIYNISLKSNGDFSSTNKTYFKSEPSTPGVNMWQRRVISIQDLQQSIPKLLIKEYDTVGTVVMVNKSESYQEVWMADYLGNLLLVKIFDGAGKCCLFDNISRGNDVAFTNVIYCEPKTGFGQGIANQFSLVTCFPQQRFLEDALTKYRERLLKDKAFLDDCDTKIKKLQLTTAQGMGSSISVSTLSVLMDSGSIVDDSLEDKTLIPSYLTSTDIAMSLIDTDQFYENI